MDLVLENHSLINRCKSKLPLVYSISIHCLLLFIIALNAPVLLPKQSELVKKVIRAQLYAMPKAVNKNTITKREEAIQQPPVVDKKPAKVNTEHSDKKQEDVQPTTKTSEAKPQTSVRPSAPKQQNKSVTAFSSLNSLSSQLTIQAMDKSAEESYLQYMADKHYIPKSKTKLGHVPEAKPVKIVVNCHNPLNKGLTILSGIMGGGVKCTQYNGAQKYIDARLEKMGKKPKKNDRN